jgi:hypothetical protein
MASSILRALAGAAALTGVACTTPAAPGLAFGPAEGLPNAVADDGNIVQDMAEGGVSSRPYVLDGTVQEVFTRSILIQSEVGSRHLRVTDRTEITRDGETVTLDQIQPGSLIRASYGPTRVAQALDVGPSAVDDRDADQGD